jgi:signal transduction histidine kinase
MNYHNPTQNQYYCKLEGVDKDWKYVGNTGQAQYASLAPGKYIFRAKGFSSTGVEGKNEDFIVITILPPFWKTWWFISGSFALALFLIYWGYRYKLNAALTRERLRTKISTDLHDDLGATLSSISILSELVETKVKEEGTFEMITEIRNGAQSMMEKMDDIVWGINPDNDSLGKLILRIKRFAAQLFEAKNIDYSFEIQNHIDQLDLSMEHRQHLYLIMKESINNLVKHAMATSAIIRINYEHGLLTIVIADNGKGFALESIREGNGLRSIRKRSSNLGAALAIESTAGHGSKVSLQVKIK